MTSRPLQILILLLLSSPSLAGAQPIRFLAFGDSITHGLGDSGVSCDGPPGGYPGRLERRLIEAGLDSRVVASGVCGERTVFALGRIAPTLMDNPSDVVLIMEGTNDISSRIGTETIVRNLDGIALVAEAAGVEAAHLSVIPRGPDATPDSNNAAASFLATTLADFSASAQRVFGDPFTALSAVPNLFDIYYAEPFHPNPQGYDLLTDSLVQPAELAARGITPPEPCSQGPQTLCLSEDRFQVEVSWMTEDGETGTGQAVELTGDTGYFWFFSDSNVELMVKALDGRSINDHFWIFYGALSNVEYTITVTDSVTGARRLYRNRQGNFASVGDTMAFFSPSSKDGRAGGGGPRPRSAPRASSPVAKGSGCTASATELCLNQDRFRLSVEWETEDGETGAGQAVSLTGDTGYFWFFSDSNIELITKVLDGTDINGKFWVFYGALSNVRYSLTVTDTQTGEVVTYQNPQGTFGSVGDTEAF